MSEKESDYGMFKTHLDTHTELGPAAEKALKESDQHELSTPELAEKVDTGHEKSYCRALLTEGREWIVKKSNIETEARAQESGGNPTIYWRHTGK